MFDSSIFEVAIGLAFVFILVSTVCSAIREGLEAWLKTRATYLEYAIRELLNDRTGDGLAKNFFEHPLIRGLYQGDYVVKRPDKRPKLWHRSRDLPSYIPSRSFALTLMDLAARGPTTDAASSDPELTVATAASLRQSVRNLDNPVVQRALLAAIDAAQGDLDRVQRNLEHWYDGAMDRVSGWYKRSTQWVIVVVALVVVGALNINTITIADRLYRDDTVRHAVVAAVEHTSAPLSYQEASDKLDGLRLPIGWGAGWGSPRPSGAKLDVWNDVAAPILGLLITAFAASLGAPFWFDVVNKITTLRATLKPRDQLAERPAAAAPVASASVLSETLQLPDARGTSPGLAPASVSGMQMRSVPDNDLEGCAAPIESPTPDHRLPAARNGIVTK